MDYTIKRGDTLSKLALDNNTTVQAIQSANPTITDPNKIYAGNTLKIPTTTSSATPVDVTRLVKTPSDYEVGRKSAQTELQSFYDSAPASKTLEQITADKKAQAQAEADRITQQYNTLLSGDRQAGDARNNRTRALNISGGLAGSDFASAAAIGTEDQNKKVIQAREAERDARINAIMSSVDDRASAEYQKQREQQLATLTGKLDLQTKLRDEDRAKAKESLQGLASQGVTVTTLKAASPETFQHLLKEYGGSELDLETAWNDALPDNKKIKYQDTIVEGPNGNAQILRYGIDPLTNTLQSKSYDLGTNYNVMKGVKPVVVGGALYKQNPDGTYVPLTSPKPKAPSTKGSVTSGALTLTPIQVSEGEKALKNTAGEDGYVDPTMYQSAHDAWVKNGGTSKGFIATYPPNNYVNPDNTWLPQYLRSTKKGGNKKTTNGRNI